MNEDETRVSPNDGRGSSAAGQNVWGESETASAPQGGWAQQYGSQPPRGPEWNGAGSWPGQGYGSGGPRPGAYQAPPPPAAPAAQPPRKNGGMGWIGPIVVILAAIVAGLLLFYFLSGKKDSSTPNGVASVATNPSQQGSPSGNTSASPSASETTAPLPGGRTSCQGGSGISSGNAVLTGTVMSCSFADRVISDVQNHVQSDPTTTNFTLPNEHSDRTGKNYSFTCNRSNHLTTCTAQGDHGQIALAVQDSVN